MENQAERGPGAPRAGRRLLVIANPYPPVVSAGTMRIQRFLRHLPGNGWRATVLTIRARGDAPVPPGIAVRRVAVPLPGRFLQGGPRTVRVKRWLFVPDPYVTWVPGAIARGVRMLREERYDAIFSSSPRASGHLVAALLSRASGVPWLADYRDPWLGYEYQRPASALHAWANAALERWALRRAAAVSAINTAILEGVVAQAPQLRAAAHVIANGFDRDEPADEVQLGEGLWLVHTGRLYGRPDQTAAFLTAFAALPGDARALFLGADLRLIEPHARRLGVASRVRVERFATHARSLGVQRAAGVLVLIAGRQRETTTSKIYEYLAAGQPVFALAPPDSAVAALLAETGGAVCVDPDGPPEAVAAALRALYDRVSAGDPPARDEDAIAEYDARRLAARLAGVLDGLA